MDVLAPSRARIYQQPLATVAPLAELLPLYEFPVSAHDALSLALPRAGAGRLDSRHVRRDAFLLSVCGTRCLGAMGIRTALFSWYVANAVDIDCVRQWLAEWIEPVSVQQSPDNVDSDSCSNVNFAPNSGLSAIGRELRGIDSLSTLRFISSTLCLCVYFHRPLTP